jgi:hypothetical protein
VIWWLAKPSRARSEGLAIAELELEHAWLRSVEWQIGQDARLGAKFEIEHLGRWIPMTIAYPSFFPDTPPQVIPQDPARISGHQYGPGGELCLEFRPDNWDPSYTGAMMIASAHRLLNGEQPQEGARAEVENAHSTTLAQDVRGEKLRFVVPADFLVAASQMGPGPLTLEISEHLVKDHWVAFPRRLGEADAPMWTCAADVPRYRKRLGMAAQVDARFVPQIGANYDALMAIAQDARLGPLVAFLESSPEETVVLLGCAGSVELFWLPPGSGSRSVHRYATIRTPVEVSRLPGDYERLADVSVAIVGCGSMGSKVAASLTRAGVGRLVLVDGDLLLPGNLVRNDLDWRSVGLHKPEALAKRIRDIRPSAKVTTRRIILGGQESAGATDAALVEVGKCDLIVDATANPQVFNLCAAIARDERKPLVWGEVFAGGIGGLVARVRPDIEPVPHAARRQILEWCADRGREPPKGKPADYGLTTGEGSAPLVADDADVSVISGHVARLAVDVLVELHSAFPQAAYAIGLRKEWIFQAPFDTWPIELLPEGTWGPQKDECLKEELEALTLQLFPEITQGDRE